MKFHLFMSLAFSGGVSGFAISNNTLYPSLLLLSVCLRSFPVVMLDSAKKDCLMKHTLAEDWLWVWAVPVPKTSSSYCTLRPCS